MQQILLLAIGMFALGMDAYVIAGLLPAVGATLHTSPSQTGQAISIFTLCYALAAPIFATLLTGKPIRKILVFALCIFSIANAASALAGGLGYLLCARAIAGIGAGLYSPVAIAAAVSLSTPQRRGRALGMTLGGMSTGTVIGVPLGLFVANYLGWQGTLWLVTLFGIIALVGIIFLFPNIPASAPPTLRQRLSMLTDIRVASTVGVTFLTSIASLGLYTYIAIILDGKDIHNITPYLWAWGIGGVIGSFSIGALIDFTKSPGFLMLAILLLMMTAMLTLPVLVNYSLLGFLPFVLWGAVGWASQAPQQHALMALQPKHGAAVVALNSSANYLGSAVGATLGGLVMTAGYSPTQLPYIAGLVILVATSGQILILCRRWSSKLIFSEV